MNGRIATPAAHVRPHEITIHGNTRVDDYFWLRERENPEVIEYLDAENEYAKRMTIHLDGFQKKLYVEMVCRMQETDSTAPVRLDEFYYYSRTEKGKQYSIHCRKAGSVEAEEEILLVPGVGSRMAHEFDEYRPYPALAQFRREMGKYVDDEQVAAYEQYVFVPIDLNSASDEDILSIPGVGNRMLREFKEYRPYRSIEQLRREMGKYVDDDEVARMERYVYIGG